MRPVGSAMDPFFLKIGRSIFENALYLARNIGEDSRLRTGFRPKVSALTGTNFCQERSSRRLLPCLAHSAQCDPQGQKNGLVRT
ncbi:hypothetical protein SAMN06297251_11666 [Fulvimarina manganoxydans]|uniref:Uncharacterized protein n=1 Tax=Fulvimarina manganoxydans TaxID=937218 RepID=A0A1W2DND0_9HYPH|nr:hypothetical protein SAMN06297251_11666 [Fulvimarina manganoxydans]